ncbi:hypothetical protein LTR05_005783 [Lithohypha guttulata]|uniref:Family A G protein-coupled receptor-like protein n=1 Tax=Lithohypha guttulata TaxID=1690604 RepID=A0AAN7YFU3_9EURO|nr:hypothetical protein LTR05_005783 [Lithohypha guttulata]
MSLVRRNDALDINGFSNTVTTNNHITSRGSNWYFTVCALMSVSTLIFMGLSLRKPQSHRLFHYIAAAVALVAAIAYFSMGSNLGWTAIQVEFRRRSPKVAGMMRQIFYVRYIDWFVTTPLLLLKLLLTCGMPTPTIVYTMLINEVMIVCGLVGALVKTSYKWGYFVFGCFAFFFVAYTVAFQGRSYACTLGQDISKIYTMAAIPIIAVWMLYPVAWGVCEGGNVIAPDSEAVFYGILDLTTKLLIPGLLIWNHRNIDLARLGFHIRNVPEGGLPGSEKRGPHQQTGVAAPATANTETPINTV